MKRRVIINPAASIAVASAGTYLSLSRADQKEYLTVTQLANIDALVQTEGEEGTPVGNCEIRKIFSDGELDWHYFCNDATTDGMIYPCPDQRQVGISGGTTKCTK